MKILLVSVKSDRAYGGIAVWTERFLDRCAQLNMDCSLVNTELTGKRMRTGKRNLWDELFRTRRIFRDLKAQLKSGQYDAAYLNTSCGSFGLFRDYALAKKIKKWGIPLITHYHCEIPYWVRKKRSRICLGKLASISRQNLVLCENSKQFLQTQYGVKSTKVPNFVESNMVLKEEKIIAPQIGRICFVGRVSETKGAKELYEVASRLPEITFDLVGEVSETVKQWQKPANVLLSGAMPNEQVIARLDDADAFLFPSHTEGCSMALMEAMARGLPCIATDVGANADMLDGCGVVTETGDVAAMVAAVDKLADPFLRRGLSCRCVKKVREHYTDKNVNKIISMITQVKEEEC